MRYLDQGSAGSAALTELPLGLVGCLVDLVEGLHRVQNRLHFRGGKLLVQHLVHIKVPNLRSTLDHVVRLSLGGNQPASVELVASPLPNNAKLDRKQEKPTHLLQRLLVGQGRAYRPIMLQEIGKYRVGVHGNVAEDVMEDIRLGDVLKRFPAPQPGSSRELPGRKHGKEGVRRQKTAHGGSSPATPGPKPLIHLGQVWD